jgi:hypothetical protein
MLAGDGFGKEKLCESLVSWEFMSAYCEANNDWQQYFGIQPVEIRQ